MKDEADKGSLFTRLCAEYPRVMSRLRVMGVDRNDLEDVAAEILVDAYKGLDGLRKPDSLAAWLETITINRVKKYFAKREKRREISNMVKTETGEMDMFDMMESEITVEKVMREAEDKKVVDELLDMLPEISRRILRMRFWGGYKHSEIAEMLHINANTERSVYKRSLARLKVYYLENFGEEDSHE